MRHETHGRLRWHADSVDLAPGLGPPTRLVDLAIRPTGQDLRPTGPEPEPLGDLPLVGRDRSQERVLPGDLKLTRFGGVFTAYAAAAVWWSLS
jgi:hypothetical protein